MANLNFKDLAQAALARFDSVVEQWLPSGRYEGAEYCCVNPNRADKNAGSFKVNRNTGIWSDFATQDSGADLISLVAYLDSCTQGEAYKSLEKFLGLETLAPTNSAKEAPTKRENAEVWTPILPVPNEVLAGCPQVHPKNGKPSSFWEYLDLHGNLLMKVYRFDSSKGEMNKKDYRPLTYCQSSKGRRAWKWMAPRSNRPLYGLRELSLNDSLPVLLTEGEKSAEAAKRLFANHIAMTWPNGSKAIGKADFSPLSGRAVLYFPDNDEAGTDVIEPLKLALDEVGVSSFDILNLKIFSRRPIQDSFGSAGFGEEIIWPEKADAADAVELGWTSDHIAEITERGELIECSIRDRGQSDLNPNSIGHSAIPFGFRLTALALEAHVRTGEDGEEIYRPICKPIEVLARTTNASKDGRNWGKLVSFRDPSGNLKQWNIPAKLFATEGGAEIKRELLDRGLEIGAHREDDRKVIQYLKAIDPPVTVGLVHKLGWQEEAFVLPDRVLGKSKSPLFYDGDRVGKCNISKSGTLDDWKNGVARYCSGNELAIVGICTAFAGPLVSMLGMSENLGLHYYGDSSLGKSTLLNVACSVYGNPDVYRKSWRTTDNALESTAAAHSDMFLALDELNQVDPKIVDNVVYMLGNGAGKNRAGDYASSPVSQWTLAFISNGEKTLEQYMGEAGKKVTGGMEMRFLSVYATCHIEADKRRKYGIFRTLHGYEGGAALSNHLNQKAKRYHGTAFEAFIEKLVEQDRSELIPWLREKLTQFKDDHLGTGDGGQVSRAADKFALLGWAGELASNWGITGWEKGEALRAADSEFKAWLSRRGGTGNLEEIQMLEHIREQIATKGESHYRRWDTENKDDKNAVIDRHVPGKVELWGFVKEEVTRNILDGDTSDLIYYTTSEAFKYRLCKGFDHRSVARMLREKGILLLRKNEREKNRLCSRDKLPGFGDKPQQVFKFRASSLFAGD